MKLLRRFDQPLAAAHCANVLQAAGIGCVVRNTQLGGGVGEIPFLECQPEVWLRHAPDEVHARELLAEIDASQSAAATGLGWDCVCGETNEPQFGACWRCGRSRFDLR